MFSTIGKSWLFQLVLLLTFWLAVAGPAQAKLNVVTSTEDIAFMARQIGGDRVEVTSITHGTQNPHFIEAKPSFIVKFNQADLIAYVGLELEIGWLPVLRDNARNPRIHMGAKGDLDMSVGIPVQEIPHGKIDRSQGDVHPLGNPHYWLDPNNGLRMARRLAGRLSELDPAGAPTFRSNLQAFETELTTRMAGWKKRMEPFRGQNVICFHKSFNYFASWVGLQVAGYVEPKPGVPPTPQHTESLLALIPEKHVKVIMVEPFYSLNTPNFLAQKAGIKDMVLPSSVHGTPGVNSYFDVFETIVSKLEQALKG